MVNFYNSYIGSGNVNVYTVVGMGSLKLIIIITSFTNYYYFLLDHINHIVDVIGHDYVGIGSDYDGVSR